MTSYELEAHRTAIRERADALAELAALRAQLTALMSGEPEVHQLRATIETLKQGTQVLEKQQRELQGQLAAKERECEELRTHLVATANQVQDNCWCAPGDKCPAHAARDYLQESTYATN